MTALDPSSLEALETQRDFLEWALDTLQEINVSNYDHDDVCRLNERSVEVILAIQTRLSARPAAPSREAVAQVIEPQAWVALDTSQSLAYKNRRTSSLRKADAILSLFAAQPGEAKAVAVKQIVWRECFADRWQAQAAFGSAYDIVRASGNQYRVQYSWSGLLWNDERPTLEAAKASAQADYEARILSCLSTTPDIAEGETVWCESCGEAPTTVKLAYAGLCEDCARDQSE